MSTSCWPRRSLADDRRASARVDGKRTRATGTGRVRPEARRAGGVAWRVRPAGDGDLAALTQLWHEADALHARISPGFFRRPDRERGRQRLHETLRDAQESKHEVILVAVDAHDAVGGACHLQIYDTPASHAMVPERRGHVETLVVAPARRRRGCGRALMAAATAWVRERGAGQMLLTVWAGNESAAQFYAALGYRTISQVLGTDL